MIQKAGSEIKTRFVFYQRPTEDEIESIAVVGTEIIADFSGNETISESYEVDAIGKIVRAEGEELVYRRKD